MLTQLLNLVFGSKNDREIKALMPIVARINGLESGLTPLSDQDLAGKTQEFKQRLAKGETLDDILPEAFAVCREMSRRRLNMRHFDVQLIGGMILHRGRISEMKTGEGKTLVATLPVYLNALEGKGVHLITVNDYLAKRDAGWMSQIYGFLGLTTGVIVHGLSDDNVVAAHTLQLSSALLAAGKPHEVLPLSGVSHMTPQEIVAENLLLLQLDFLRRHLPPNA